MTRSVPVLFSLLLFFGCATAQPPADVPDPVTEPTISGAIEESAAQAGEEAEHGAQIGLHVGRVVGVFAAIAGLPADDSTHDTLERYRNTRDAITATGALIGAAHGGREGARRGLDFDTQFAELQKIDGVVAARPLPSWIEVRVTSMDALPEIAKVLLAHDARVIGITAADDQAFEARERLIESGLSGASLSAHRDDAVQGIAMRIGYPN